MEWISVKDKVPAINVDVLVWNGTYNECQIMYRLDEIYDDSLDIRNRYAWSNQGIVNEIEWWMPLPEPPKEC